ncbi:lactonase family protein [Oleiharenicola lentus]|jgi:6-phosphogluconolactonase|uniref:Lactonase family protein n=1 Tax=Oleiharenicola lentus TaxID=2508720 RepID=A0A4Q1CBS2_9BACT|nr:lactonase family protein [Oleiharenicola lentus]RXK56376.1 lactonase family protein [Oleiharenicola lentus]
MKGSFLPALLSSTLTLAPAAAPMHLYLGTSTSEGGPGILTATFDADTGTVGELRLAATVVQPGFFALHPTRPILYSTIQTGAPGDAAGAVVAFTIDPATGKLAELGRRATGTAFPVHLSLTPDTRYLLTCSYGGAAAAALPLTPDGGPGAPGPVERFSGSSVHPERQQRAFPHSINADPTGRHVFVCDLGADTIVRFTLSDAGSLQRLDPPVRATAPGAGPRHLRFSADGRHAYVVNELANTLSVYAHDPARAALDEIQTVPLLPADFKGPHTAAEVRLHPNGRFLYASNRGHEEPRLDSITVFAVDPADGRLTLIERVPTGHHPRHFTLDPTGRWLLVAARESDRLELFSLDPATGRLQPHGDTIPVRRPLNLVFFTLDR